MKEILTYMLGTIVCSGVLMAFYSLMLERRVKFAVCRAYLPWAMRAAAIIPLLKIPVWAGKTVYLQAQQATVSDLPLTAEIVPDAPVSIDPRYICFAIWACGALLMAGIMTAQLLRMRRLSKNAATADFGEYRLLKVNEKISSFSFFRTIFVSADTRPGELQIIIAHEAGHIRHHHSAERIDMEVMKALLWWNPFVWIAARRLTEVQEYEADSEVLGNGYDIEWYINTLLKHLFGYSPDIANGLRDSLTKKRLKMMTNKRSGRYGLLRMAAVVPVVGGLMSVFSFTAKATQVIYTSAEEASPMVVVDGQKADEGALDQIDSQTIESITILKEENAKSSYGHLGDTTDGVIVVETKESEKITVSGTVTDSDGKPVVGAAVVITASQLQLGSVTDKNGKFTLKNAPASASVTVSYVGMERTMKYYTKAEAANLNIVLAPEKPAGKTRRISTTVTIRNDGSEPVRSEALVIVDGKEVQNLDGLAPDSIASITIVKNEEEATRLYGDKAQNGLIIVQTKQEPVTTPYSGKIDEVKVIAYGTTKKDPVIIAQKMPEFEGGDLLFFRQWVMSNIRFPKEALDNGLSGRVAASFIIDTEGKLGNIEILASPDEAFSNEVRRVLEKSPAWTPGEDNGAKVNVKYTIPVDFSVAE